MYDRPETLDFLDVRHEREADAQQRKTVACSLNLWIRQDETTQDFKQQ